MSSFGAMAPGTVSPLEVLVFCHRQAQVIWKGSYREQTLLNPTRSDNTMVNGLYIHYTHSHRANSQLVESSKGALLRDTSTLS